MISFGQEVGKFEGGKSRPSGSPKTITVIWHHHRRWQKKPKKSKFPQIYAAYHRVPLSHTGNPGLLSPPSKCVMCSALSWASSLRWAQVQQEGTWLGGGWLRGHFATLSCFLSYCSDKFPGLSPKQHRQLTSVSRAGRGVEGGPLWPAGTETC